MALLGRKKRTKPQVKFTKTRDGWKLATYRYPTDRQTSPWGPVLLVHGLSANRANLDAPDPQISLAHYLHERRHDVWVVELRGAGRSRPPGWPLRRRRPFDFDDYVHRDIPAIVRRVLDDSGSPSLHWVGHSMGGMLAYAALEHYDQQLFRSVVTIGSPAFTAVKHPYVDLLYKLKFMLHVVPWLPLSTLGKISSPFPGLVRVVMGDILANAEHMEKKHIRQLLRVAVHDLPAPLLAQFAEWYGGSSGFARRDGLLDYSEHLSRIEAPLLVIAGAGDTLTPVDDLMAVFDKVGSPDKQFLVVGREDGFSLDYGHIDLVLGTRARQEVYPRIAQWIEHHA